MNMNKQKLLSDWLTLKPTETADGSNTSCDNTNGEPHSFQPHQMGSTTHALMRMRLVKQGMMLMWIIQTLRLSKCLVHKMVSNKVDVEHDDIELEQGHGDNVDDTVSTCTVDTD